LQAETQVVPETAQYQNVVCGLIFSCSPNFWPLVGYRWCTLVPCKRTTFLFGIVVMNFSWILFLHLTM